MSSSEHLSDASLLDLAYSSPTRIAVRGNRVAVAGSETDPTKLGFWTDWFVNDLFLVPLGLTRYTDRYQRLSKLVRPGMELIGHSLGAAVEADFIADLGGLHGMSARLYNWPKFQQRYPGEDSFRDLFDPISVFDRDALIVPDFPHSYRNAGSMNSFSLHRKTKSKYEW